MILYISKGETIPVRLPLFRLIGVALLTPASGLAIAAIAIVAVCWLTLKTPSLLRGQVHQAGIGGVVSLMVMSRFASGIASRGAGAAGK